MDISETYIKMRVAAIPDLGMGDKSFALKLPYFITDDVWIAPNGNFYCHHNLGKEDVTIGCQLERQDQLQEMIKKHNTFVLVKHFELFCNESEFLEGFSWEEKTKYLSRLNSMEQLWLAFVMKEKYEKLWDGNNWVK